MRKIKLVGVILLCAALLFCGAVFPWIIALVQDWSDTGKVQYENIDAVQLSFVQEKEALTILEKIAVLRSAEVLELPEEETQHSHEEVYVMVEKALLPYREAGLIPWGYMESYSSCTAVLVYDPEHTDRYVVCWNVSIVNADPYIELSVMIDDETGALLFIDYTSEEFGLAAMGIDYLECAELLYQIYFSFLDTELAAVEPVAELEGDLMTGESAALNIYWEDEFYGEVFVRFYTCSVGFDTTFG